MTPKDIDHYQRQALIEMVRKAKAEAEEAEVRLEIAKLELDRTRRVNATLSPHFIDESPVPGTDLDPEETKRRVRAMEVELEARREMAAMEAQARAHYGFPPTPEYEKWRRELERRSKKP